MSNSNIEPDSFYEQIKTGFSGNKKYFYYTYQHNSKPHKGYQR